MSQLHNTTAVSPDRVDRCNLLEYHIVTAAAIRFTSFFSHPIYDDARITLALPMQ